MSKSIYLDNSATTRISDVALAKYNEVSLGNFGNPSSLHGLGFNAEREIDGARRSILSSLGVRDASVIFTASGSEANNLALIGRALAKERYMRGAKIITTSGEHASVDEPLARLEKMGFRIAKIPTVGGKLDLEVLKREMTSDVILVSMMMVNNETGALYDVKSAAAIAKAASREALIHIDATQSYMKLPMNMRTLGADMITVSSHKIGGPKGVGALVVAGTVMKTRGLAPIILGGGQEGGMRSGTENVPGIAAFGAAVEDAVKGLNKNAEKMADLREYLIEKLTRGAAFAEISITNPEFHAPHILNITLPKIKSETMLHFLSAEGIFVSSGSACSSNSRHVSSALVAYGRTEAEADCSIRISFSHENSREDVDALCEALEAGLARLARMR